MPRFSGKSGIEEDFRKFQGQRRSDDPCPQDENVHVVVLNSLAGGIGVVAQPRADSRDLVGGNAHAHTAAADEDPSVGPPVRYGLPDRHREIRVINGIRTVGPQVLQREPLCFQIPLHLFLDCEAGMV